MMLFIRRSTDTQKIYLYAFAFFMMPIVTRAQITFAGFEHLFTEPKSYVVQFTAQAPTIDGDITDKAWSEAQWTESFVDIEGSSKPKPAFDTRTKMLWNDTCLFVAAELEEPHIWAMLQKRDNIIYHDNDFEVFIDPGNDTHQYFEIEVNAFNTILDLFMAKPYRNGSSAMLSFNLADFKSAVKIKGTLNRSHDKDTSWTVEMAIPFRALYIGNQWKAPDDGTLWRINFSRVQWDVNVIEGKYQKRKDDRNKILPEHNWVWSPQGVVNMHLPERWGYLQFSRNKDKDFKFILPYNEKRRRYLWLIYYKQKEYWRKHNKYSSSLNELQIATANISVEGKNNTLTVEATSRQFSAYIGDGESLLSINDEGLVQSSKQTL